LTLCDTNEENELNRSTRSACLVRLAENVS
jgi:hypothetical protein